MGDRKDQISVHWSMPSKDKKIHKTHVVNIYVYRTYKADEGRCLAQPERILSHVWLRTLKKAVCAGARAEGESSL